MVLLEKKVGAMREYKKGMISAIFSGKLRFKDENGNPYPDWEEKRLGDVIAKNSQKNKNNEINFVQSVSNIYGFVAQEDLFEDRIVASDNLRNYYVIKRGTFAYNPSRIDVGSLAYKSDNNTSVVSPLYVSFRANNRFLVDGFLFAWFKSNDFQKQMHNSFEGSVRNTLNYFALSSMKIKLPSLIEQQKIADFLSAIDHKIELEQTRLDRTKDFKKGLLQRMFV